MRPLSSCLNFKYISLYEAQVPRRSDSPAHSAELLQIALNLMNQGRISIRWSFLAPARTDGVDRTNGTPRYRAGVEIRLFIECFDDTIFIGAATLQALRGMFLFHIFFYKPYF